MKKIISVCFLLYSLIIATENRMLALKTALKTEAIERCASILCHMEEPLNFMQENGGMLVHEAASRDFPDILALFLGYKAPLDYIDPQGYTSLMRAAAQDHSECMKLLLAHGAEVNFQNSQGLSALHVAADWDKLEAVGVLLAHGANMYLPSNDGFTAYAIANSTFERQNLMPVFKEYAKRRREVNSKILHLENVIDCSLKSLIVRDLLKKCNDNYTEVATLIGFIRSEAANLHYLKKLPCEPARYDAVSYIYDFCFPKSGEIRKD